MAKDEMPMGKGKPGMMMILMHLKKQKKLKSGKSTPKAQSKMEKTMHEFKEGQLRSGSKSGPPVTNRKQAIAIGLSQARKAS